MSSRKKPTLTPRARWGIASRVLAATAGAYVAAALWSAVIALALPQLFTLTRADAVLAASLFSFVLYAVIALSVFCARSAWRVWLWMGLAIAVAGGAVLLMRTTG